ncbi:MAG: hypothetical protein F6K48_04510 [Okeania sp. SIO3H1]|uniref:hypothetical protein n=1 Tax=Okeania sp. SIO1I7 TaxID=2607772 RepID=UPI0013CCF355|nr:hypothetical protein [Okeania sp. SIO1I7]NEN88219.1 hypothetical protein [Okeania sp. SIO3H1]NET26311.1 hypothetical protein [Okeania sp. SIO1I7]
MVKRVYDINLNYLGVSPQESVLRSQPTPSPSQEGKKEEERGIEGESFLLG